MKVSGIAVVREGGKVSREKTLALFAAREQVKFNEKFAEFSKLLDFKLSGGKDNEDHIAEAVVKVWDSVAAAKNTGAYRRENLVSLASADLVTRGIYTPANMSQAQEDVEAFIFDNAYAKNETPTDAWMCVTTGRGRGAGMVWEKKRPSFEVTTTVDAEGETTVIIPATEGTETDTDTPTNADEPQIDEELAAQIEAASAALVE